MDFAILALRNDPDYLIFDVEACNPPVGTRGEYDCIGVYRVSDPRAVFYWVNDKPSACVFGVVDAWKVNAQQVACGEYGDQNHPISIEQLWPTPIKVY